jgi:hypothetical protein
MRLGRRRRASSGGTSVPSFNLTSLSWSTLYMPSFTGSPWTGTASAGASSGRNLTTNPNVPTVGTAQNGYTPATFNGTNQGLRNTGVASNQMWSTGSGTILALIKPAGSVAATGNIYDDAGIILESGGDVGLTYTNDGIRCFAASAGYKSRVAVAPASSFYLVMARWNGSVLGLTVNSGAESTVACGAVTVGAGTQQAGYGYAALKWYQGDTYLLATSQSDLSASYADIKTQLNSLLGLTL